jgi:hypothetical protein
MSTLNQQPPRPPAVAGRFYPADPDPCRAQAQSYLKPHPAASQTRHLGGVVPHAGWVCSGAVAGQVIATLSAQGPCDIVVIFGAVHTPLRIPYAALDSHPLWSLPTGLSTIAQNLFQPLLTSNLFAIDPRLHDHEHAIEVNLPLLQLAFPNTPILPIEVPPIEQAERIGRQTAQTLAQANLKPLYLASSDFTHYGPNYQFAPVGIGPHAMRWSKDNDKRLLDLITQLAADKIVPEVRQHHNACGAGAIAALLAACRQLGATSAQVLSHTTSYETLAPIQPQPPTHAVGYAAVVVG